jgi:large conductance mechanosensitive channel
MATTQKNTKASNAKKAATASAVHVKGRLDGFVDFIRGQGVIGLAVGLAIGTAAGDTVKRIVEGFINPVVQFIVGSGDKLATATWHVELFGRTADFAWGAALSSLITLLATALVIYWIVYGLKLDKLDKKK